VSLCVSVHYIIISLNRIFTVKKIKYLGVFENEKYQEIINELKKNEDKPVVEPQLTAEMEEMEDMKNSLIEIMRNSI
jgi:translation elongation factor EF-Tu-like GTPase